MEHFVTTVALVGIVIVVASLLSGALERSGLPVVAVFIALGATLGPMGLGLIDIGLDSAVLQTLAMLALALVLFSDAVTLDTRELRIQRRLTWRMLGPGTLVPTILIALAAHYLLDLALPAAAILGAALASTDPVLLRSLLRAKALPVRARTALRVEAGMNDVVLLPVVVLGMLMLRDGGAVSGGEVARSAIGLFVLGPAIGAIVGWVGIRMLATVRGGIGVRRDYESMYALGLAFSAFALAEEVGGSGFLAAFAAGLLVSSQDVELCDCFLEYGEATAEMLLLLTFVAFGGSLIWQGLTLLDGPTLLFAALALVARTAVLYPMLAGIGLEERERRMIALFGPRGLSSLLFALLPVFAGTPGARYLFTVTCLVVLMSVVLHGGGIALYLRASTKRGTPASGPSPSASASIPDALGEPTVSLARTVRPEDASAPSPERITIAELREMRGRGAPVTIVDVRAERSYAADDLQAVGAVRVQPDDAARSATAVGLSHHGTLVIYCA